MKNEFKEYKPLGTTARIPKGVVTLTTAGWFFGRHKPDFEYARILFNQATGTVKFEPTDSREHIGIGYLCSITRRGSTTYTLRNIKFVDSGIAPKGKYKAVDGEENTYKFFMPSVRKQSKTRDYSRLARTEAAKKQGKEVVDFRTTK